MTFLLFVIEFRREVMFSDGEWIHTHRHDHAQSRDESGSKVNGSLGQPIQNLSMGQLGPGSNINFNCNN